MKQPERTLPERHYMDTTPYWDGLQQHRLVLQYCLDTGRYQHFPRPTSLYTGSRRLTWREVSGQGQLEAWTLNRHMTVAHDQSHPPLSVIVALAEGVRILGWLQPPGDMQSLHSGAPVQICWPQQPSWVPTFALAPSR